MKKWIIIIIILLGIDLFMFGYVSKPDIQNASHEQLMKCDGIGVKLAEDILEYISVHEVSYVDQLQYNSETGTGVKYIGDERIDELKKHFK